MAVFGFGRRNAVGRQYNGGNVSVMLPRYTTPPERNTRDWLISIHALREEGDSKNRDKISIFL